MLGNYLAPLSPLSATSATLGISWCCYWTWHHFWDGCSAGDHLKCRWILKYSIARKVARYGLFTLLPGWIVVGLGFAIARALEASWAQNLITSESVILSFSSVTNSSSGLIFVKIRAESGRICSKNPGKIRAKLKFCDFVVFLWFWACYGRYFVIWQAAQ